MISIILQGASKRLNLTVSKLAKLNFYSMNFKKGPEESIYFLPLGTPSFSYEEPANGATLDTRDSLMTFCCNFDHLAEIWSPI